MAVRGFFLGLVIFAFVIDTSVLSYDRPPARETLSLDHLFDDISSSSPQQVHISLVGQDKMKITWIPEDHGTAAIVNDGTSKGNYDLSATGTVSKYKYILYKSGEIHDVVIGPLKPDTVYYYRCGSDIDREFSFKTPPSQFPIKFTVAGDLGQTGWTDSTLTHMAASNYDVMLLPGTYLMPIKRRAKQMRHAQNFWGSYYFIRVLYRFESDSDQYKWLQADLDKIDRSRTPWVFVLIHAPWYSTNETHQGEHESVGMKKAMEELIYKARVDVIFAGHVHAYERFTRVYADKTDNCGPVHITIGDGGNREGLASNYMDKPSISVFREASFGHGRLEVVNETYASWSWHRNQDDEPVSADTVWLKSLSSDPACMKQ
ncbi:hypothetical protein MKX01_027164 [Papaver californicum]|nr:hypothetical protein MKX01_027164 [Papaver californicum]